jgi:YbbR domain-containing protein
VVSNPERVEIVGPEEYLKQVSEATTEPVNIEGAKSAVSDTVTIGVARTTVRLREPGTARVTVEIVPAEPPNPKP